MRRAWLALAAATVMLTAGCNDSNKTVITDEVTFDYTVTAVACGGAAVGDAVPKGQFCTVAVTVHNRSGTPHKPGIAFAKAYDAHGTGYAADAIAGIRNDTRLLDDLAAGATIDDKLFYDVPKTATISTVQLRESPSSPVTTVDVTGRRST